MGRRRSIAAVFPVKCPLSVRRGKPDNTRSETSWQVDWRLPDSYPKCKRRRYVQKNPLYTIFLMSSLFLGIIVLMSWLKPPKIPDAAGEKAADVAGNAQQVNNGGQPAGDGGGETVKAADPQESPPDNRVKHPHGYYSLGRFDSDASPLVVQFDAQGATVRRVELNARKRNGDFLYRDVDSHSAWIGHLELEPVEGGGRVRLAVPGTPAAEAGVVVGDLVSTVNGEPVISNEDFQALLDRLRAGEIVELAVQNAAGEKRVLQVPSRRCPMQVIRPVPENDLTEVMKQRRAFMFALKEKSPGAWPDLDAEMRTANWKATPLGDNATDGIEFSYELPVLADGRKFEVVKRFTLPKEPDSWHLNLTLEIRNLGEAPTEVQYELWGPGGLPVEGWWYQQKIHGNTWAFGKMAGARDIWMSTNDRPYQFFGTAEIVANEGAGLAIIGNDLTPQERTLRSLVADTHYFVVALQPSDGQREIYSSFAAINSKIDGENKTRDRKLTDVSFVVYSNPVQVAPYDAETGKGAYTEEYRIFAGPKDPDVLEKYQLDNARSFGWFGLFSKPLVWLLHLLHTVTFGLSWGLAIILLTVIVRTLMIPVSRKAALNAQMMQHLAPQMKKISEEHKGQPEKAAMAQRELFAKYRYNPFGGCFLILLQMPIFLGLYRGLSVDVALRDAPLIPGLKWCSNLAGPDQLLNWQSWMPGFLGSETGWLGPWLNVLPLITVALMLVQQKMFMPPATDDQSRMMQSIMKYMMIFMAFLFFKVASGLCIYFITSSIWGIVERKLLPKPELNVEKFESRAGQTKVPGFLAKALRQQSAPDEDPTGRSALERKRQIDKDRERKLRDR
jgi:YidC/Oxa1 family membrane protein insertase